MSETVEKCISFVSWLRDSKIVGGRSEKLCSLCLYRLNKGDVVSFE